MAFLQTIRADLDRDGSRRWWLTLGRALFTSRLQAVLLFRLSQQAHRRSPMLASLIKYVNGVLNGCDLAAAARIGPGLVLYHPTGVVIGPDAVVGARCRILQHATLGAGNGGSPILQNDVTVLPGAVIAGKVTIGERAVIGANSVVVSDVPAKQIWSGIPARYIRDSDWVLPE